MKKIAVFASGTGSNFLAIHDAFRNVNNIEVSLLISDRPNSKAVEKAKRLEINHFTFRAKDYQTKKEYEEVILGILKEKQIDLIVLAGYMRLTGNTLLNAYQKRIINIHPSLLPSFKGIDAVGQAMNAGVKVTGVTVHYVDEGMDTGEIIAQRALDITNLETRDEIENKIHKIEHQIYPDVIKMLLEEE